MGSAACPAAALGRPLFAAAAAAHRHHLQLFTWSGSSARVAFSGASSVTVVLDSRLDRLPADHRQQTLTKKGDKQTFPWAFFRFEIDGKAVGIAETSQGKPVLTWTRGGLAPGAGGRAAWRGRGRRGIAAAAARLLCCTRP